LIHNPDRILAGLAQPGDTVLDLGCGMGYFSISLARMVGPRGRVICVDLQQQMLAAVRRRAERAGVADRIQLHQPRGADLGLTETAAFALAFWMLHEVPDQTEFLTQVRANLIPGGRLLIVEPRLHVSGAAFERSKQAASQAGLRPARWPSIAVSRAVLLEA
jgi:ubiquinone/menaquinone biosynthesis C-methylase UbiE